MSPTRIEEKNKEEAENQPLLLDSGASQHVHFERRGPTEYRSQGGRITIADGSEIAIREFKNEFNRLLSVGALQRQEHPADLLTRRVTINSRTTQIYARATSHVHPEPTLANLTRLTAAGNRYQTTDISNNYLHLPFADLLFAERQRIGRANYARNYCHTHSQNVNHNAHQCGNENVRRRSR